LTLPGIESTIDLTRRRAR